MVNEYGVANFIPPANGASQGSYLVLQVDFCPKHYLNLLRFADALEKSNRQILMTQTPY